MRYLAWIAIFSLQLSIFVCEAGVDVCYVGSTPSQVQLFPSDQGDNHVEDSIDNCAAHAAHVFLGYITFHHDEPKQMVEPMGLLGSLIIPEVFSLIEQPPKALHS